jgi:putative transposase
VRRKLSRYAAAGMRGLFAAEVEPSRDRRRLPVGIRRAIVELKAEYPPFSLREIAAICRTRFDRPVDHHTVKQVLASETRPIHLPRRFRPYHEIPDPEERRKAIVDLALDGWSAKAIAGYLATSRARVYDTLHRWLAEEVAGLADRSREPHRRARKVDLKAMAAIRRLQANPELGEFRIHAALQQMGIDLQSAHLRAHPRPPSRVGDSAPRRGRAT